MSRNGGVPMRFSGYDAPEVLCEDQRDYTGYASVSQNGVKSFPDYPAEDRKGFKMQIGYGINR